MPTLFRRVRRERRRGRRTGVCQYDEALYVSALAKGRWGLTLASKVILAAVLLLMRREDAKASVVVNGSFIFCRR